jgi:hypothetical protein
MTLARRVAALEADGDATSRVVRWLEEAHAFDTLEAYVAAEIEGGDMPMDRLPREAIAAVRGRKGPRSVDIEKEVAGTVRDVVFRIHLALRIIEVTMAALERETLVHAYLMLSLAIAMDGCTRPGLLAVDQVRDLLMDRVALLIALEEARTEAERRYLGGNTSLFLATAGQWAEQLHLSQMSAVSADRIAELDGLPGLADDAGLPTHQQVAEYLSDLVEVARIKTLGDVGDGRAALLRVRSWYQPDRGSSAMSPSHG